MELRLFSGKKWSNRGADPIYIIGSLNSALKLTIGAVPSTYDKHHCQVFVAMFRVKSATAFLPGPVVWEHKP